MTPDLSKLETAADAADREFFAGLLAAHPVGSEITFTFNDRQKRPTSGKVVGAHYDGRYCVRLATMNRRGQHTIKRVYWRKVLP